MESTASKYLSSAIFKFLFLSMTLWMKPDSFNSFIRDEKSLCLNSFLYSFLLNLSKTLLSRWVNCLALVDILANLYSFVINTAVNSTKFSFIQMKSGPSSNMVWRKFWSKNFWQYSLNSFDPFLDENLGRGLFCCLNRSNRPPLILLNKVL